MKGGLPRRGSLERLLYMYCVAVAGLADVQLYASIFNDASTTPGEARCTVSFEDKMHWHSNSTIYSLLNRHWGSIVHHVLQSSLIRST